MKNLKRRNFLREIIFASNLKGMPSLKAMPSLLGMASLTKKFAPHATVSPPWHGYTNVMGNCLATVVIAKWEGEFQEVISESVIGKYKKQFCL